jgi:hypothetical protein
MITYSSDYACAPMMWGAFRALAAKGAEQVGIWLMCAGGTCRRPIGVRKTERGAQAAVDMREVQSNAGRNHPPVR